MAFSAQLIGVLSRVPPFDRRFFVLPLPRLCEHDIVLFDPRSISHPARDAAESFDAVSTAKLNVVSAQMRRDDSKAFVLVGHTEGLGIDFVAHTIDTQLGDIKRARVVVPRNRVEKVTRAVLTAPSCESTPIPYLMPEITVSDTLYDKLEEAASDDDFEPALWEMVYRFERGSGQFE